MYIPNYFFKKIMYVKLYLKNKKSIIYNFTASVNSFPQIQ